METAKEHFDKANYQSNWGYEENHYVGWNRGHGGNHPNIEKEDERFEYVAECITRDRRYDRYYTTLLRDKTDNQYYITDLGYAVGGDSEYRNFYGSIIPISNEDAETFIKWSKLKFVQ